MGAVDNRYCTQHRVQSRSACRHCKSTTCTLEWSAYLPLIRINPPQKRKLDRIHLKGRCLSTLLTVRPGSASSCAQSWFSLEKSAKPIVCKMLIQVCKREELIGVPPTTWKKLESIPVRFEWRAYLPNSELDYAKLDPIRDHPRQEGKLQDFDVSGALLGVSLQATQNPLKDGL